MSRYHSLTAIRSYVGAQMKGKEAGQEPGAVPKHAFVTISREAGAGGTTVAKDLAELLNQGRPETDRVPWTVFDRELVERVLREHGLPKSYVAYIREEAEPAIEHLFGAMYGVQVSRKGLATKTARTILNLAGMGNAIIVGRAAAVVTRRLPGGIHVRLVGTPEVRLRRMMKFYKLEERDARKTMSRKDSGRRGYVRKYFDEDVADPMLYDLVINTDRIPYPAAARLIAEALTARAD
jgi:cytidylate kinase